MTRIRIMTIHQPHSNRHQTGLGRLESLPVVPALEYFSPPPEVAACDDTGADEHGEVGNTAPAFADDRESRLLNAVIEAPLQPSSRYPKLAGISTKTAVILRRRLVEKGYLRERTLDTGRRGRSTILLEVLPAGMAAIDMHKSKGPER